MTPAAARVALELAVEGPAGAAVAARAGADRIELCAALAVHGVTPSLAAIEQSVAVGLPVHVLVRPRAGGFEYDASEIAVMRRDVEVAVGAGAAGVVIGGVRDGGVDVALVRAMRDAAGAAALTFHRAFDTVSDPRVALDALIDLGVARVLTSGGAEAAIRTVDDLRRLVDHAAGRMEIMAGGGVAAPDVAGLVAAGVDAVHASARSKSGGTGASIDPDTAGALRAAVDAAAD